MDTTAVEMTETSPVAETVPETVPEVAPKAPKQRRKGADNVAAASAPKTTATLDDVMELLDKQDEALKVLAGQAKDMLATNAAVRRAVRQAVKDASRQDELVAELERFKKRWANLKSFVS